MFSHKTKLLVLQGFAFCEFREGIFSDSSTSRCRGMLCDIYKVLCILSISATYPVVEAWSVSFVSSASLRRNPLRRIQMYKACSVPFVASISLSREFSTIHLRRTSSGRWTTPPRCLWGRSGAETSRRRVGRRAYGDRCTVKKRKGLGLCRRNMTIPVSKCIFRTVEK